MSKRLSVVLGLAVAALTCAAVTTGLSVRAEDAAEKPPEFTEAYLTDPANIEAGHAVWQEQCRHCHGKSAYPGKAPKLKPKRYKPEFVFKRVTNGFRKMPSWKEVFSYEERKAVVAYVLSKKFSP
jgi:mono/diheme cytochrome c family protein